MTDSTLTIRVDEKLKNEFTKAAKRADRSGAQLIREFMRTYLNHEIIATPAAHAALRARLKAKSK